MFWIDAADRASLERSVEKIAQICWIGEDPESLKAFLSNAKGPWLLIFDNVDDPDFDIAPYFPTGDHGSILITTRNSKCQTYAPNASYDVTFMEPNDALELLVSTGNLCGNGRERDRELAKQLIEDLDLLALAIFQAGAQIGQKLYTIDEYHRALKNGRHELLSQPNIPGLRGLGDYRESTYTTWEITFKAIEDNPNEAEQDAVELLKLFSCLQNTGISEHIFHNAWLRLSHTDIDKWYHNHLPRVISQAKGQEWDFVRFRRAIIVLDSFSLANRGEEISVHPLVHSWAMHRLKPADKEHFQTIAISIVALSTPLQDPDDEYSDGKIVVYDCDCEYKCEYVYEDELDEDMDVDEQQDVHEEEYKEGYEEEYTSAYKHEYENGDEDEDEDKDEDEDEDEYEAKDTSRKATVPPKKTTSWLLLPHVMACTEFLREALKTWPSQDFSTAFDIAEKFSCILCRAGNKREVLESIKLQKRLFNMSRQKLGGGHQGTIRALVNLSITTGDPRVRNKKSSALTLAEKALRRSRMVLGEDHLETLRSKASLIRSYSQYKRYEKSFGLLLETVEANVNGSEWQFFWTHIILADFLFLFATTRNPAESLKKIEHMLQPRIEKKGSFDSETRGRILYLEVRFDRYKSWMKDPCRPHWIERVLNSFERPESEVAPKWYPMREKVEWK